MFTTNDTVFERIKLIGDASARVRYAFAATTLACSLIITSVASAYLTWMHSFAVHAELGSTSPNGRPIDFLQKRLLEEWAEAQFITVPILGLRIHVSEVSIFGPLAIVVLMIWYYYSQRREKIAIEQILGDLRADYESKCHHLVTCDRPSTEVSGADYGKHLRRLSELVTNQLVFITIDPFEGRWASALLWMVRALPIATILFAGGVDFLTFDFVPRELCIDAAFRQEGGCVDWLTLPRTERHVVYFMIGCSILGFLASTIAAREIGWYSARIKDALLRFTAFCDELDPPEEGRAVRLTVAGTRTAGERGRPRRPVRG